MATVERVGPADWRRVRALRMRALDDAPDAFWVTAEEEAAVPAAEWQQRLARSDAATFVASRDGDDVGMAVGASHHEHPADAGLYALWVAPPGRGAGVARALVIEVAAWARREGFRALRAEVGDANAPAIAFYERLRFHPSGATATFRPPRAHVTEHERVLPLGTRRPHGDVGLTRGDLSEAR